MARNEIRRDEFEEQHSPGVFSQGTSGAVSQNTTRMFSQDISPERMIQIKTKKVAKQNIGDMKTLLC